MYSMPRVSYALPNRGGCVVARSIAMIKATIPSMRSGLFFGVVRLPQLVWLIAS